MLSPRPRDAEKVLRGNFFISWGAERMTADSKLACNRIKNRPAKPAGWYKNVVIYATRYK